MQHRWQLTISAPPGQRQLWRCQCGSYINTTADLPSTTKHTRVYTHPDGRAVVLPGRTATPDCTAADKLPVPYGKRGLAVIAGLG